MDVDQNKGVIGAAIESPIDRESIAIPTVAITGEFSRMQPYFAQRICAANRQNITKRELGPTQAGLTIAQQSRINREPIANFIGSFRKLI